MPETAGPDRAAVSWPVRIPSLFHDPGPAQAPTSFPVSPGRPASQPGLPAAGDPLPLYVEEVAMHRAILCSVLLVLGLGASWATPGAAQEAPNLNPGPATPSALGPAIPPELTQFADDWPAPQGNLAGTRAAANATITAANVATLAGRLADADHGDQSRTAACRPHRSSSATPSTSRTCRATSSPSTATTATVKWSTDYDIPSIGPNGLALGYGLLYGPLGDTAEVFALARRHRHRGLAGQAVGQPRCEGSTWPPPSTTTPSTSAPSPAPPTSFYGGGRKGILYALDAGTGAVLWQFDTTTDNLWGNPRVNNGGGLWEPPSVDAAGNLYFGTGNPGPFPGGTMRLRHAVSPTAPAAPATTTTPARWSPSTARPGAMRWSHNATPARSVRPRLPAHPDPDHRSPSTARPTKLAIGSGKAGTVIAADADTGEVLWKTTGRQAPER